MPPIHQAVQAAHAGIEAARLGLIPTDIPHPHLVVCLVADEASLRALATSLEAEGIRCALFAEPDRNNELTALCTQPVYAAQRRHFRKLPLLKFPTAFSAESPGGGCCA